MPYNSRTCKCIGKLSPILSVTLIASLVKHILKGSCVNDKKKFNEEEKNQLNSYSKHYTPHESIPKKQISTPDDVIKRFNWFLV